VVVPPILAVAADREVDGEALLVALAAGMEAIVRIGLGLDFPEFRSRGWHTPGVAGPLGAALGVARLMKLDNEWSARAMGIAAEHASGTFAVFGTPSIKFNQARAAMAGLLSAEMARRRFGAPDDILTAADGGLLATFAGGGKPDLITNGLGSRWELTEITTRLWPAAAALQSVIAMLLDPNSPPVEHIESVTVGLSSANFEMHAGIGWETPFHAQLSTRYVTSVAIHDRRCWLDQFRPERLTDSEVVDFASRRVKVIEDPALGDGGATLRFDTRDGEIRSYRREVPKGHPLEPATWEETAAKLASAVSGRRTRGSADEIVEMVASLENLSNSRRLAELLSSG
jgi:2-methylcitrate dehydratase PrpD